MKVLWLVLALLFITVSAEAATYYVDKAGNNGNSCATAATASSNRAFAKLTITAGVACATAAGDSVIVGNGTYVESQISLNSSGTVGNPITLRAEHKWLAILSSTSGCAPNISIYASYVTIDGLSLVIDASNVYCTPNSAAGTGVRCWPGPVGCTVRNLKTDNPSGPSGTIRSHGIKTNQHNSLLEDNELAAGLETISHDNIVRRNHITGGGQWRNGIVIKGGSRNNQVYDNVIDANPAIDSYGIILGGSTCAGCSGPGFDQSHECWNCVAWNNVVIVSPSAIALAFQSARGSAFFNNVAVNGSFGMEQAVGANINNVWKNNIISCNGRNATQGLQGTYTIDYNNFFNCSNTPSQAHPITGDPRFVNPQSDWRLSPGSPAIGSGTPVLFTGFTGAAIDVSKDMDGLPRIAPWSLGAYRAAAGTADITPPRAPSGLTVN